jgi:hypothetical protein
MEPQQTNEALKGSKMVQTLPADRALAGSVVVDGC